MILDLLGRLQGLNRFAHDWFILLADGTMKGTLILAAVILLFKMCRRPTSQTRHLILFLAVLSLALTPLLTQGIFIPTRAQIIAGLPQIAETPAQPIIQAINEVARVRAKPAILIHTALSESHIDTPPLPHWTTWLFLIWVVGIGFSGFILLRGFICAYRLSRTASTPEGSSPPSEAPPSKEAAWMTMMEELKAKLRVRIPVSLKFSPTIQIPIMNGIWKPVILLPESMADWPCERLQAVLLHELSHIKRYDNLTQSIANLIALVYWFNPLAWLSLKLLKTNREYACDDLVLWTGIQPTTYASELMMVIRGLKTTPPEMKQVAMFATTKVEQRMVNILAKNPNRKPLTKRMITALTLITTIIIVLSSLASPIGFASVGNMTDGEYQKLVEQDRIDHQFRVILDHAYTTNGEQVSIDADLQGAITDFPTLWPEKDIKSRFTSPFGMRIHPVFKAEKFHIGIDIRSPKGTPIVATGNGTVVTADWMGGYGYCVIIEHKSLSSLYSKLQTMLVHPGDVVQQGDIIGYSGNTGIATGPHMHYEIRYGSFCIDPKPFLEFQEQADEAAKQNPGKSFSYTISSGTYQVK